MSLQYNNTTNAVLANTETQVLSYTPSSNINLVGFIATGDAPAKYILRIGGTGTDGTINATYRTSPVERTAYVVFPNLAVTSGTNIYVNVINEETDGSHNYEATLIYS